MRKPKEGTSNSKESWTRLDITSLYVSIENRDRSYQSFHCQKKGELFLSQDLIVESIKKFADLSFLLI